MPLPRETLRVLRYIHTHEPLMLQDCVSHFGEHIRERVVSLLDSGYIEHSYDRSQSFLGKDLGFVTTNKGKNLLIDDHWATRERIRDSILVPIAVSVITSLLVTWLSSMRQ